jgi:hypothetical protein
MKTHYHYCSLIVMVFALLPSSCAAQRSAANTHSLQNTTWQCKVADSCIDEYKFHADSSLTYYSCETLLDYRGNYQLVGDTLIIREKGAEGDDLLPLSSAQRSDEMMYKAVIKKGSMRFVEAYHRTRNQWIKIKLESNYVLFKK